MTVPTITTTRTTTMTATATTMAFVSSRFRTAMVHCCYTTTPKPLIDQYTRPSLTVALPCPSLTVGYISPHSSSDAGVESSSCTRNRQSRRRFLGVTPSKVSIFIGILGGLQFASLLQGKTVSSVLSSSNQHKHTSRHSINNAQFVTIA